MHTYTNTATIGIDNINENKDDIDITRTTLEDNAFSNQLLNEEKNSIANNDFDMNNVIAAYVAKEHYEEHKNELSAVDNNNDNEIKDNNNNAILQGTDNNKDEDINNDSNVITILETSNNEGEDTSNDNDNIELPMSFKNVEELTYNYVNNNNNTVPFFFHVPATAGTLIQHILSICYNKVQISNFYHHNNNNTEPLQILSTDDSRIKYININAESENDINRGIENNLIDQFINNDIFISSPQLYLSSSLLSSEYKGKMFTLLRHPIHRAIHLYNTKRQRATATTLLSNMTIIEYANSKYIESNWLTRFLSNNKHDILTENDLNIAKKILERKCLVGIIQDYDDDSNYINESIHRFIQYFNLNQEEEQQGEQQLQCKDNFIQQTMKENNNNIINFEHTISDSNEKEGENVQSHHQTIQEDSKEWQALLQKNLFDMKVYEYALQLFEEQGISMKKEQGNYDNSVTTNVL